ncbi:hypothetical protein SBF1_2770005 [Candidatus Desulfosporosinus infrequens]|uniref:Uncharacterized protein n=1 Tax=Candidatus Desulfosporosinus infrequens TaxID=2043169 RepID=A0A2U3KU98_9FIRM|nr:hypothetical protein SBF1_2770005 [Candidatus Desulfosporosinus infrequens]
MIETSLILFDWYKLNLGEGVSPSFYVSVGARCIVPISVL